MAFTNAHKGFYTIVTNKGFYSKILGMNSKVVILDATRATRIRLEIC
jgi:hypothetical protein